MTFHALWCSLYLILERNKMRKLFVAAVILIASSTANAGTCGGGKIIDIKEGGWHNGNWDGLFIKVDNSRFTIQHPDTFHNGYIHFSSYTMPATRLEAIRRMALVAFTTKADVFTFSATGSCKDATEISLIE